MSYSDLDTIAAIATPPGIGGVGIIRVSGKMAKQIGHEISHKQPTHQKVIFSQFYNQDNTVLDSGYLLFFKNPASFTGEDVIELQGHGGPVVMDMMLERVLQLGARLAEPGEFTKRAFLNDKIDLVQAEAIADLIESSSRTSVKLAQRALSGVFSEKVAALADKIIQLRMYIEAALDFPEEEIDFISDANVSGQLDSLRLDLKNILKMASQGAVVREGIKIVIVGKPNAGKSTLINQLSGEETAIVTAIPGTTRDILKEQILINNIPSQVIDTAGLRESDDLVEQEGIKRTKQAMLSADLVIQLVDIADIKVERPLSLALEADLSCPKLLVINKIDKETQPAGMENGNVMISAKEGEGVALLKDEILKTVGVNQTETEGAFLARRRHLDALERTQSYIEYGSINLIEHHSAELLAEDLKYAHKSLCEITGEFTADDLLGKIFSSFCIGK